MTWARRVPFRFPSRLQLKAKISKGPGSALLSAVTPPSRQFPWVLAYPELPAVLFLNKYSVVELGSSRLRGRRKDASRSLGEPRRSQAPRDFGKMPPTLWSHGPSSLAWDLTRSWS